MNKILVALLVLATVGTMCVMDVNAEAACKCPFLYAPVCGTDGVTYNNQCLAHCKGATVSCGHECPCGRK